MSIALSVDPAVHGCGCALWIDRRLVASGYAPNLFNVGQLKEINGVSKCVFAAKAVITWVQDKDAGGIDYLIVELPQVYPRGANRSKGDPNKNVLPLAMVDAALAALLPGAQVYSFQPHAWKKGTSKPDSTKVPYVITTRVKQRLNAEELRRVDWPKSVERSWDVSDALGVGLYHFGRFDRERVLSRE